MSLIKWYPSSNVDEMRQELNKLFNLASGINDSTHEAQASCWSPEVDLWEDAESYFIAAELPGLCLEDVSVQVEDGQLILKGSRPYAFESGHKVHRVERAYGDFNRLFPLPTNLDFNRIAARMKDGILTITLPKSESARPREISIIAE